MVTLWPGLRYLSFGVWLAWVMIVYSGSFWLSDIETNSYVMAQMYMVSTAANAVVLLIAPLLSRHFKTILASRAWIITSGVLAMIGALFIVLAGPDYFTSMPLFIIGDILTGVGTAVLSLKCGELYSELQPWRALIYALLSQLIIVVIYFFVLGSETIRPMPGGLSAEGILAMMFLPVITALLLVMKPSQQGTQQPSQQGTPNNGEALVPYTLRIRALSPVFWKFLIAVFIFTLTTSIARSLYTYITAPSALASDTSNQMVLRAIVFTVILLLTVRFFKHINFGKPYLIFMGAIAVIVALCPMLRIYNTSIMSTISFAFTVFGALNWCLLAFIVFEKRISPIIVFGFGRGIFMAGSALGWIIGTQLMPQIIGSSLELVIYIAMAFLILLSTTLVFSEKDFDNLFSAFSDIELDMEEDLAPELVIEKAPVDKTANHGRPYVTACKNVGALAGLSTREQDILEMLAMGRGSENIAKRLSISLNTVRTHTHNIYAKLDVHSRQELIDLIELNRDHNGNPTL